MGPGGISDAVLGLERPWRGRLATLIASTACGGGWDGREPTHQELAGWLERDRELQLRALRLLRAWGALD